MVAVGAYVGVKHWLAASGIANPGGPEWRAGPARGKLLAGVMFPGRCSMDGLGGLEPDPSQRPGCRAGNSVQLRRHQLG